MQKHKKSYEEWLLKAQSDLKASQILAQEPDTWDVAVYHTQQTAEKALKAFLDYSQEPLVRTHDLEFLVGLCSKLDSHFSHLKNKAATINPYASKFRYPDDVLMPDANDVTEALECAEYIVSFVKQKIKT